MAKLSRAEREEIAEKRLFSVLGSHGIATARTLEQKISDAGPNNQRIDPHILTSIRNQMVKEDKLVRVSHGGVPWFAVAGGDEVQRAARLAIQLPVYQALNAGGMAQRVGQALEIAIYRSLLAADAEFQGRYKDLEAHDDSTTYSKEEPPQHIGAKALEGNQSLDFLLRHDEAGWMGLECKNVREWMYPDREEILETLRKCLALNCVPVIIARRVPYVSYRILARCGVIFLQFYNQRIPQADEAVAAQAKHKTILGFHDIKLGNEPDDRMLKFFAETLPKIAPDMRERYDAHRDLLSDWAYGQRSYDDFAARVRRREEGTNEEGDWD